MKNKKIRILTYAIALSAFLLALILYPMLPDQIPTHWNTNGTVTYSSRNTIFLMVGLHPLFAVLFDVLPKIDPRRQNYDKFGGYYDSFCILMQVFMLIMNGIILIETFRPGTLSVPMSILLGIGLLFLFLGNIMPKFKSNFYMGIKTPWTISSEEVWWKTHRLGGKCFVLVGLLSILCAFLPLENSVIFGIYTVLILIACLIPVVMSYVWWRQEQNSK